MMKSAPPLLFLFSLTLPAAAQQGGEAAATGSARDQAIWMQRADPLQPRPRAETYYGPYWEYEYHPERWTIAPLRPPMLNPYPPKRWGMEPYHGPAENPYPPKRWQSPPSGPQWLPPPPRYYYWSPGPDFRRWQPASPSELPSGR